MCTWCWRELSVKREFGREEMQSRTEWAWLKAFDNVKKKCKPPFNVSRMQWWKNFISRGLQSNKCGTTLHTNLPHPRPPPQNLSPPSHSRLGPCCTVATTTWSSGRRSRISNQLARSSRVTIPRLAGTWACWRRRNCVVQCESVKTRDAADQALGILRGRRCLSTKLP